MAKSDIPRLAVLGAGPIGLEVALHARSLDLPVTVYERGQVGEHLHRWGHLRMFTSFGMNSTSQGRAAILQETPGHGFPPDRENITGREYLACYLEPLLRCAALRECVRTGVQVVHVGRRGLLREDPAEDPRRGQQPFRLLLRTANGREEVDEADVVVDCTGTYGKHRWMGDGGLPALGETKTEPQIAYGLEDIIDARRNEYAGRSILVVVQVPRRPPRFATWPIWPRIIPPPGWYGWPGEPALSRSGV